MKSKYDYPEGHRYYDEGWNDYIDGLPPKAPCTRDYWDGYNDAKEADEEGQELTRLE